MQWPHSEMQGDLPPPCRTHSAALMGRKVVTIGGGEGAPYYHSIYAFDIPTRHAHITVLYRNKIWAAGAERRVDGRRR